VAQPRLNRLHRTDYRAISAMANRVVQHGGKPHAEYMRSKKSDRPVRPKKARSSVRSSLER
jgi:hypothetical protein